MSLPNLVPRGDNTGSLGTSSKRWNTIYAYTLDLAGGNEIISGSFSGSFEGDGSGLTGVVSTATNAETASYVDWSNVQNISGLVSSSAQIATEISGAFSQDSSSIEQRLTDLEGNSTGLWEDSGSHINRVSDVKITGSLYVTGNSEFGIVSASIVSASFFRGSGALLTDITATNIDWSNVDNKPSGLVSSSAQIATEVSGAFFADSSSIETRLTDLETNGPTTAQTASYVEWTSVANKPTVLSSSAQIAEDISGSFYAPSSSFETRITTLESQTQYSGSFSGSFQGDGSQLTGLVSEWDGTLNGDAQITGSLTVSGSDTSITTQTLIFDTNYSASGHTTGRMYWNDTDKTVNLDLEGSDVKLQIGQEQHLYARNNSGVTINNGDVVKISGATGNKITISKAIAQNFAVNSVDDNEIIGVATEQITNNSLGYVTVFGTVRDLNTSAFTEGSIVYLSSTTSGSITQNKPAAPIDLIKVGIVERSHPNLGQIFVRVEGPTHINDITGITGSNIPTGKSYWEYDSTTNITRLSNTLSGSFSGSFEGNGSGLTGVVAVATPGGSDTDLQFNKSSATSGSSNLQYDYTNDVFKINSGQLSKTTRITTSTYTVLQSDYRIGIAYSLTGSANIQLPLVSDVPNQEFRFKDEEGNARTNRQHILASGSDVIDGAPTASMKNNYEAFTIYNNGINKWFVE